MDDFLQLPIWLNHNTFPEKNYISPNKNTIGFCFSGGGNRAFSAAIGQIAGLNELNLLHQGDYLSAVSGGSWAATVVSFASMPLKHLLGDIIVTPKQLTWDYLNVATNAFLGRRATINLFELFQELSKGTPEENIWIDIIRNVFLKPYGLQENRNVTFNQQSLQDIVSLNPELSHQDVYLSNVDKPYLIINATLIWPDDYVNKQNRLPVEFTPLATGIYASNCAIVEIAFTKTERKFGGGYVSSFGFNSEPPVKTHQNQHDTQVVVIPKPKTPLTLADMTGTSSAFFALMFDKFPLASKFTPHFNYWPIQADAQYDKVQDHNYSIGDGGNLENYGIIPLLIRQVDKLIIFINSEVSLDDPTENEFNEWVGIDSYLPPLFGLYSNFWKHTDGVVKTQVFPTEKFTQSKDAILPQLLKLKEQQKALICQTCYPVLRNDWLGISDKKLNGEPYQVNILWVYLSMPNSWKQQLPAEIQNDFAAGVNSRFPNFPHYATIGTDFHLFDPLTWGDLGGLSLPQVKLLSQLTYWTIMENQILFKKFSADTSSCLER